MLHAKINVGSPLHFSVVWEAIPNTSPGITFSTRNKVKMSTISKTMTATSMTKFYWMLKRSSRMITETRLPTIVKVHYWGLSCLRPKAACAPTVIHISTFNQLWAITTFLDNDSPARRTTFGHMTPAVRTAVSICYPRTQEIQLTLLETAFMARHNRKTQIVQSRRDSTHNKKRLVLNWFSEPRTKLIKAKQLWINHFKSWLDIQRSRNIVQLVLRVPTIRKSPIRAVVAQQENGNPNSQTSPVIPITRCTSKRCKLLTTTTKIDPISSIVNLW
jgi:hypothetical protein